MPKVVKISDECSGECPFKDCGEAAFPHALEFEEPREPSSGYVDTCPAHATEALADLYSWFCPKTADGQHVADPSSIAARHSDEPVVDIHCKACGCSGSVTVDVSETLW